MLLRNCVCQLTPREHFSYLHGGTHLLSVLAAKNDAALQVEIPAAFENHARLRTAETLPVYFFRVTKEFV